MHCKACNIELKEEIKNPDTGEFEELCKYCLALAYEDLFEDDFIEDLAQLVKEDDE